MVPKYIKQGYLNDEHCFTDIYNTSMYSKKILKVKR